MKRGAQPGNRNAAGKRKQQFTERELRRLLVLPAARQFNIFLGFHRDGRTYAELMRETGASFNQLTGILSRGRKAIGLRKIRRTYQDDWTRPQWAREESLNLVANARQGRDRDPYPWTAQIEAVASRYFLGFALRRHQVAQMAFVQRMSRAEIARHLSLKVTTVQSMIQAVYRCARSEGTRLLVQHRGGIHGGMQGGDSRCASNFAAGSRA